MNKCYMDMFISQFHLFDATNPCEYSLGVDAHSLICFKSWIFV